MATLADIKVKQKMGIELSDEETEKYKKHVLNVEGQKKRKKERNEFVNILINKHGKFSDDKKVPTMFRGKPYKTFIQKWNNFVGKHENNFQKQELFLMAVSRADKENETIKEEAEDRFVNFLLKQLTEKGKKEFENYKNKRGSATIHDMLYVLGQRTIGDNLIKEREK